MGLRGGECWSLSGADVGLCLLSLSRGERVRGLGGGQGRGVEEVGIACIYLLEGEVELNGRTGTGPAGNIAWVTTKSDERAIERSGLKG
jgi:hypothetical protein